MINKKQILKLSLIAFTGCCLTLYSESVLINGDFESTFNEVTDKEGGVDFIASGWIPAEKMNFKWLQFSESSGRNNEGKCQKWENPASDTVGLQQNAKALAADTEYRLSLWYKANKTITVKIQSESGIYYFLAALPASAGWTQFKANLSIGKAQVGHATVIRILSLKGSVVYIDDVILSPQADKASSANEDKTYYSRELCDSVDKDAIRKSAGDSLARFQEELPGIERFIKEADADKNIMADAFVKRLEITKRLGSYIKNLLKSEEKDALLYARQGERELKQMRAYFREASERVEFLKTSLPEKILDIKQFGAKGDGIQNDAPAFAKAIEDAKKSAGRVKLFIPAGTYLFGSYIAERTFQADADGWRSWKRRKQSGYEGLHVPVINGLTNFTIEGEKGTVLLGANPSVGFFVFKQCSYITVRNLVFDYKQLPFTQGVITAFDPKSRILRMKLDDGFPAPDLDYFLESTSQFYMIPYKPDGSWRAGTSFHRIGSVKDLGDGLYDIKLTTIYPNYKLEPGHRLVIDARYNDLNARILRYSVCEHILNENITIHASPSGAIDGYDLGDCAVINCKIMPPPGSKRLLACNADLCLIYSKNIGSYLANNIFECAGDDTANQYIAAFKIKSISEDGLTIILPYGQFAPGHVISLLDPNDGVIKGEAAINAMDSLPNGFVKITLGTPLPAKTPTMDSLGMKVESIADSISLDNQNFKASIYPCVVMDTYATGSGTIISKNVFRHAYRGVLTKVSSVILEGNTIEGMEYEGESIMMYANFWHETYAAHNVVIRNNLFRNNGGGVSSYYQTYNSKTTPGLTPLRDILVENNVFDNTRGSKFENCQDVRIVGNKFGVESWLYLGVSRKVSVERNSFVMPKEQSLKIGDDAKDVSQDDNTFSK